MSNKQNVLHDRSSSTPTPTFTNPEQRLTDKQVADFLQISRSAVWALTKGGNLPAPERYGKRCTRWRLGDILETVQG